MSNFIKLSEVKTNQLKQEEMKKVHGGGNPPIHMKYGVYPPW